MHVAHVVCVLHPLQGTSPNAAAHELRTLIHGLHAAGLEVLLSVEFCLMGESGDAGAGRLQGLRGIDHNVYYRCGLGAGINKAGVT